MMDYLLLLMGLTVLLVSGEFLVRGGVSLARRFQISTLVVGMTVVSMGTSAPELVVSLKAVLSGKADFSTGTVIGSNISNMALVLGLTALVLPIAVNRRSTFFDWPVMFLATLLFYGVVFRDAELGTVEGVFFVALLVAYVWYSVVHSRKQSRKNKTESLQPAYSLAVSVVVIIASVIGLRYGATWLVEGASGIASSFGVSDYIISVTVVAFGTSVPELATSLVAAFRKETDISIGNILGSNLFNILGILGVTAMVKPIQVNQQILDFDIFWLGGICLLLLATMIPFKTGRINRWEGGLLLSSYLGYLYFLFSETV